jgi:hypothetical protein
LGTFSIRARPITQEYVHGRRIPVKEPNKDDEQLSALLEGQVRGQEREELLAHLTTSDDDYAVFADTASVLRALEEEDARAATIAETEDALVATAAEAGVIPLRPPRRRPFTARRWLAVAASIAAIVLVSTFALRTAGSAGVQPVQLAARVHPAGAALPAGWSEAASAVRGPGGAPGDAAAVRAGALLTTLAVAARAGDSAQVHLQAVRLGEYDPGGETPLARIAERPGAPPDSLNALLDRAADRLAGSYDERSMELGAWLQAARLAARSRGDEEFFRDRTAGAMLRRAERMARDNPDARAAVDRVRDALPEAGPVRWDALQPGLDALLTALAS